MEKDKLTICNRCGGNACYEQVFTPEELKETVTTWLCMGCGFTTSTLMVPNSKIVEDLIETAPELHKALLYTDKENRVWAPATITLPGKGMVFLDGTDEDNWKWAGVQAVEITAEERKEKSFPEDQTHRMDMKNIKHFDKREFMDACEVIGFFDIG